MRVGEGLGAQGVVGRDWRLGRAARRALPRRRALAGAWPRDGAALRRPRAPGRGCILGPLAQPSQRLPEADSSQRSHTNTAPHHVGCPTRQTQRSSRHRPRTHKQHPSLSPPETRRTLTHTQNSTHSTYPAHQRSPHIKPPFTPEAPMLTQFPLMHAPPFSHTAATHAVPLPAAAPRGAFGVCETAGSTSRANKRLLLPAPPKKGCLSGVSGGRGGGAGSPTLRPCPTWRTPHLHPTHK